MANLRQLGAKAAADVFARVMRPVAAVKTNETASAVHVAWEGDEALVRAGEPVGPYGWEPIQGLMFENNLRHPLFGNKRHWYHQGHYPITETTVTLGIDDAVNACADAMVEPMLRQHGIIK